MKFSVITLLCRVCAIVAVTVLLLLGSEFSASATNGLSDTAVMEVQNDNPEKTDEDENNLSLRVTLMGFGAVAILLIVTFVGRYFFSDTVENAKNQYNEDALPPQTDNGDDSSYGPPPSWP